MRDTCSASVIHEGQGPAVWSLIAAAAAAAGAAAATAFQKIQRCMPHAHVGFTLQLGSASEADRIQQGRLLVLLGVSI